jgi:hypothetical protein
MEQSSKIPKPLRDKELRRADSSFCAASRQRVTGAKSNA